MAKRKGSLLRQLTLSLGLAIVFLSLASFYYQYQVQKRILLRSIHSDQMSQASLLRAWLAQASSREERMKIAERYITALKHREEGGSQIIIVDAESKILADNTGREAGQPFRTGLLGEAMSEGAPQDGIGRIRGDDYVVALPCYAGVARQTIIGGILLRQPLTPIDNLADLLMFGALGVLIVTLVIMVAVVHVVLREKVAKPMQAIFMQEYRIREGDLATIDAEDPANEFSDLYAMYNEMVLRIAEQKKAILDQKDHVALARLVRQAISRLTEPLDEILTKSRLLLDTGTSVSDDDQNTLKHIIGNVTRIVRELRSIVVEGSKSATWLQREADKIREYKRITGEQQDGEDEGEEGEAREGGPAE